jgi:DNA-binding NtrC family response regulator
MLGYRFDEAVDLEHAHSILSQKNVTIVLLDTTKAENSEPSLVREMRSRYPDTLIIATSSIPTIESAVETMRAGAFDYLSKPFSPDALGESLRKGIRRARFNTELLWLKKNVEPRSGLADLLGQTVEIEKLYRMLSRVTNSISPVLITGESGTGKGLLAKSIHLSSQHPSSPFISIDCRTVQPSAIEEALFGGANHPNRLGLLASPQGGTVFLKEVGRLPLQIQARLAKAIKDKEIISFEGNAPARVTVRIVAASCENLTEMVFRSLFRRDLHNSLSLVSLTIPPLRSRPDDVLFLAKRFLEELQDHTGVVRTLSDDAQQLLQTYDWPNNMRELERTLAFACAYSNGKQLETADFPGKIIDFYKKPAIQNSLGKAIKTQASGLVTIAEMERHAIQEAVRRTGGTSLERPPCWALARPRFIAN